MLTTSQEKREKSQGNQQKVKEYKLKTCPIKLFLKEKYLYIVIHTCVCMHACPHIYTHFLRSKCTKIHSYGVTSLLKQNV